MRCGVDRAGIFDEKIDHAVKPGQDTQYDRRDHRPLAPAAAPRQEPAQTDEQRGRRQHGEGCLRDKMCGIKHAEYPLWQARSLRFDEVLAKSRQPPAHLAIWFNYKRFFREKQ